MSGILGQLLGGVLGSEGGQPSALAGVIQQVISSQGGVSGLVSRFESAGLGAQVQSWIGNGQNAPITAGHIAQTFAPDQIQAWAQQAGTTPDQLRNVLAQALPHVVDHMTPNGAVPAQGQGPDLSSILSGLLGGGTPRQS